jgi:hypothetical protein
MSFGENMEKHEEKLLYVICFHFQVFEFLTKSSRYGAIVFTPSTVTSYGNVAMMA